jgi:hypothetical protein
MILSAKMTSSIILKVEMRQKKEKACISYTGEVCQCYFLRITDMEVLVKRKPNC